VIISEEVTDAIVVFGLQLGDKGELSDWLKARIDAAVRLYKKGKAKHIIFCGYYPLKRKDLQKYPEATAMKQYCLETYPEVPAAVIFKEERSLSTPDSLIFLRSGFPNLKRFTIVTQKTLGKRIKFLQEMIYGRSAKVEYVALPSSDKDFPLEAFLLDDMKCTFAFYTDHLPGGKYKPGEYQKLLNPDGTTRWDELRLLHHDCPFWSDDPSSRIRHPHSEFR